MAQNQKRKQAIKGQCRHHAQINGSDRLSVIAKKCLPGLRRRRLLGFEQAVCTENLIRIDCVTESPNVNGDDRALLPLSDPVRLAVQVEEPT